jgi:Zn ribbon nucleic-acid-binding protein
MKIKELFCSACNHQVMIAITELPVHGGQATLPDEPQVVCMDFGKQCSGETCPLFGVGPVVMGVRLARSGLREQWETLPARCPACEESVELQIVNGGHAVCPACHATVRFGVFNSDDADYVALAGI